MKLYLAGPMRGIEAFNFPAFHAATARLRALGHEVWSPAENDVEQDGFDPTVDEPRTMKHYMGRDLPAVLASDAVAVLPGWDRSTGAMLEVHTAAACDMPILDAETLQPITVNMGIFEMPRRHMVVNSPGGTCYPLVDGRDTLLPFSRVRAKRYGSAGVGLPAQSPGAQPDSAARRSPLPEDAKERERYPIAEGCFKYFPAALAHVAEVSRLGNEQHNPGEPMHWARGKSTNHADKILRHLVDHDAGNYYDKDGVAHIDRAAWRCMAMSQEFHEKHDGAPMAPNARVATKVA